MVLEKKRITVEEFDEFVNLSENADKLFEFIGGEIFEVPSNPYSSAISINVAFYLKSYLMQNNLEGYITGEQGGYMVSGERYAPDVAFISWESQSELPARGYNPNPPDLAVEVVSPSDDTDPPLSIKIGNYLAAGTIVWVVYPDKKEVTVYVPGEPVKVLKEDDMLDGGVVLPGFQIVVKDFFPKRSK